MATIDISRSLVRLRLRGYLFFLFKYFVFFSFLSLVSSFARVLAEGERERKQG